MVNPVPVIVVISSTETWTMTDQNVMDLMSNYLPQYSPFIQPDHIYRFLVSSPDRQPFDTQTQSFQNSSSDSQPTPLTIEENQVIVYT